MLALIFSSVSSPFIFLSYILRIVLCATSWHVTNNLRVCAPLPITTFVTILQSVGLKTTFYVKLLVVGSNI